jgi:hypothetical protein
MFKLLLSTIAILAFYTLQAQQVTNIQVSQAGDKVVITYDISSSKAGQTFDIKVECSADGGKTFSIFPKSITGDLKGITVGSGKRIVWDVLSEQQELSGDQFVFQLVATINNQRTSIKNDNLKFSADYQKYKKSKSIWLVSAITSATAGTYSYLQSKKYYDQYQTATDDATDLHQKVELYDKITPIAFGVAGLCTIEFFSKAGKQAKAKKQSLSLTPVSIKNGAGIGLAYTF